jgi:hypothetical protein
LKVRCSCKARPGSLAPRRGSHRSVIASGEYLFRLRVRR